MSAAAQLLVIVVAMLVFWAIVMRPARNQQRRIQELQNSLEVGQEVVLSSGIFGTVRALNDGKAELEVAPGVVITVARQVVVRRVDEVEGGSHPLTETAETDEATGERPSATDPTKTED